MTCRRSTRLGAASLIPFLENDANRALNGSNMHAAVPLLQPSRRGGHRMEQWSRALGPRRGKRLGVVEYVSADRVVVRARAGREDDPVRTPLDIYNLTKYGGRTRTLHQPEADRP